MNPQNSELRVDLVDFPETPIAAYEHRGAPERLGESIRAFIAWRRENRLSPDVSATYNLVYDDPALVAPADYRFDIACSVKAPVPANDCGVVSKTIPGGRCARLRHTGTDARIGRSVSYLYYDWLPDSGEEPRDFPIFFHRVTLFPDVPEHEMVTDIYLPLQSIA